MKASFRITDEGRAALSAIAAPDSMTHAQEVQSLMAKGMKISIAHGHCVWAFAPRKIAELTGTPYIAALPAAPDLTQYMALGGEVVQTVAAR
jgi:hypothetical protein